MLFDAHVNGQTRKAIAAMRTDGYLFMVDRVTGKPLGRIEERRVAQDALQKTSPTQPYPVGAEPVLLDCDYWKTQTLPKGFELGCFFTPASFQKPNLLAPAYGMRATPMAFDPQTQFFYATGSASLQWFWRAEDPDFYVTNFNSRVPGLNQLSHGVLAAIDSRTDKIAWKKEFRVPRARAARSRPPAVSSSRCRATGACRHTTPRPDRSCGSFKRARPAEARRSRLKTAASSTSPRLSAARYGPSN